MISTPSLSTSSSSILSIGSFSSFYLDKKSMLSVRLFSSSSHRRRHSHWGFYKMFSSSDPTLYTSTTTIAHQQQPSSPRRSRRQSCCYDRRASIQELTPRGKPTTIKSIRAMELEALIDSYPHYTLHLTLTPRLCLDTQLLDNLPQTQ